LDIAGLGQVTERGCLGNNVFSVQIQSTPDSVIRAAKWSRNVTQEETGSDFCEVNEQTRPARRSRSVHEKRKSPSSLTKNKNGEGQKTRTAEMAAIRPLRHCG